MRGTWMETRLLRQLMATFFGFKNHMSIVRIIMKWLPHWGRRRRELSILLFIDKEFLTNVEPQSYIYLGLRKVTAIIDRKDFFVRPVGPTGPVQ